MQVLCRDLQRNKMQKTSIDGLVKATQGDKGQNRNQTDLTTRCITIRLNLLLHLFYLLLSISRKPVGALLSAGIIFSIIDWNAADSKRLRLFICK